MLNFLNSSEPGLLERPIGGRKYINKTGESF